MKSKTEAAMDKVIVGTRPFGWGARIAVVTKEDGIEEVFLHFLVPGQGETACGEVGVVDDWKMVVVDGVSVSMCGPCYRKARTVRDAQGVLGPAEY